MDKEKNTSPFERSLNLFLTSETSSIHRNLIKLSNLTLGDLYSETNKMPREELISLIDDLVMYVIAFQEEIYAKGYGDGLSYKEDNP